MARLAIGALAHEPCQTARLLRVVMRVREADRLPVEVGRAARREDDVRRPRRWLGGVVARAGRHVRVGADDLRLVFLLGSESMRDMHVRCRRVSAVDDSTRGLSIR